MKIKKAIIPAAGLGTRMLPATKTVPKEMLPVAEKPLIQYVVEEAIEAGIEHILIVTAREKAVIEDHFDRHLDLEAFLIKSGKPEVAKIIQDYLPETGAIAYLRQDERLGLGHAIWCARHWVGDEAFAILSPDELLIGERNCTKMLMNGYEMTGGMMIAMQDLPREDVVRYGVISGVDVPAIEGNFLVKANYLVEKPSIEVSPSNHCIIGRYVLDADIFSELGKKELGAGNEIQLTDAINKLLGQREVYGMRYDGGRFDCGKRTGWLEANIAAALKNPTLVTDMSAIIAKYYNAT